MNDGEVKVIRVGFLSHMNPCLTSREMNNDLWFLWNDTMTNIQILTINYNKDEQLYTTRMNTIYTR